MGDLTFKELIILIAIIAAVVTLVVSFVKKSLSIILTLALCIFLFSGFTWLPEKIKQWTGSDVEPSDINQTVEVVKKEVGEYVDIDKVDEKLNEGKDKAKEYWDQEGDSWINAFKSLWSKINGGNHEELEETTE